MNPDRRRREMENKWPWAIHAYHTTKSVRWDGEEFTVIGWDEEYSEDKPEDILPEELFEL